MGAKSGIRKAIKAIQRDGILLVFPIDNRPDPHSLWSELHPRTKMRWEWDEDGDHQLSDLWHLRSELATSRHVVYTKWYKNRATFFSRDLFAAALCLSRPHWPPLTKEARDLLETLEMDSPLSTKQLKEAVGLQGRFLEPLFVRSLKTLWDSFRIVAFGEVEDSSFPSLALGATQNLFEDLWIQSLEISPNQAQSLLDRQMPPGSHWRKYWDRSQSTKTASPRCS
jgi:hypothetical protein